MSGGSYNYFYSRAPEELRSCASTLREMADRCQERAGGPEEKHWKTGEAIDLAALAEAGDFLRMLSFRVGGMARVLENVGEVARGVEWWQSGDTGPDHVIEEWKRTTQATNEEKKR